MAKGATKPRGKSKISGQSKLTLADATCPICMSIEVEPVTMPCHHELCLQCFQENVQKTNLACPLCRKRISTWARKAARENTLVNKSKWKRIQQEFPKEVQRRLDGLDDVTEETREEFIAPVAPISQPGEIKQEFEKEIKKWHEEQVKLREKENQASEELIIKIKQEEEEMLKKLREEQEKIAKLDEILVHQLCIRLTTGSSEDESVLVNNVLSTAPGPSTGSELPGQDLEIICEDDEEEDKNDKSQTSTTEEHIEKMRCDTTVSSAHDARHSVSRNEESLDSIGPEMSHFRPICAAPRTPPKLLPNGQILEPALIQAKPQKLDNYSNGKVCVAKSLKRKLETVADERQKDSSGFEIPADKKPRHLNIHSSTPFTKHTDEGSRVVKKENIQKRTGSCSPVLFELESSTDASSSKVEDEAPDFGGHSLQISHSTPLPRRNHTAGNHPRRSVRKSKPKIRCSCCRSPHTVTEACQLDEDLALARRLQKEFNKEASQNKQVKSEYILRGRRLCNRTIVRNDS